MQGKGTVKNPLTVIAIFAGTAEISGTAVLPLLEATSQSVYIWFLMLFPFTLIALFFITLNWNHKVLYAPSDFKDEDHFVNIMQRASVKDKLDKLKEESSDEENIEEDNSMDSKPTQIDDEPITSTNNKVNTSTATGSDGNKDEPFDVALKLVEETNNSTPTTKEARELRNRLMATVHRSSRNDAQIAEKLAIEQIEKEIGVKVDTDMKFEFGRRKFVFDGVARKDNKLTAIEVKYIRDMKMSLDSMFLRSLDKITDIFHRLSEVQKKEFSLIFAIVTDSPNERRLEMFRRRVDSLEFPAVIKVYDFDQLTEELVENAS